MEMLRARGGRSLTSLPPMRDFAAADFFKPGDHAQRRRLAAAGRPDQRDEFAVGDFEIDAVHDLHVAVALDELFERDGCHRSQPFTAPEVRPDTRCFCTMKVSVSAGMIITTASAHMPRQSMVNSAV